jgi:hypothetical protein
MDEVMQHTPSYSSPRLTVETVGRAGALRCANYSSEYNIADCADFQHHIVWLTLDQKLSYAPIKHINRALDVGCGTGIWAIDFGTTHLLPDVQQLTPLS